MSDKRPALVIENGSGMCKAGLAQPIHGIHAPQTVFPMLIGRQGAEHSTDSSSYIGYKAFSNYKRMDKLKLTYPVERGIVTNWDDMEKIWSHLFSVELGIASPEQQPVMLIDVPSNPKSNRERMTQTMFETFNVPAMFVQNSAMATLYNSGRSTGIVLDSGHGVTQVVPIVRGIPFLNAAIQVNFAGHDLTEYLEQLLSQRGHYFKTSADFEAVRYMKQKLCYVAWDFDKEMSTKAMNEVQFELGNGKSVTLGHERSRCAEALFQPVGSDKKSYIPELIVESIRRCDCFTSARISHSDLYANIIVAGGCTMLPGFAERLKKEIALLALYGTRINIIAPPERQYSAWIGASRLASVNTFQPNWITRKEYDESGCSIVHRKCF